jgi:hypothetical protein
LEKVKARISLKLIFSLLHYSTTPALRQFALCFVANGEEMALNCC